MSLKINVIRDVKFGLTIYNFGTEHNRIGITYLSYDSTHSRVTHFSLYIKAFGFVIIWFYFVTHFLIIASKFTLLIGSQIKQKIFLGFITDLFQKNE